MMDLDLEFEVAKAAHAVHLIERALHGGDERWEFSWGVQTVPVQRIPVDDGIVLRGCFEPVVCYLVEPERTVRLLVDGDCVAVRLLEVHPGDGAFTLDWSLTVETAEARV